MTKQVEAHRVVTLLGVGGVGKTRLAAEVAAELLEDFPDGVCCLSQASSVGKRSPGSIEESLSYCQSTGSLASRMVSVAGSKTRRPT